jgi:hypothetical protein
LSEAVPGVLGAIMARSEAQTLRLALLYALLDGCRQIDCAHLDAALALWRYCEASARYIFSKYVGDPLADTMLERLRAAGDSGMTRTAIYQSFHCNIAAERIDTALQLLAAAGLARMVAAATAGKGRPTETWYAIKGG